VFEDESYAVESNEMKANRLSPDIFVYLFFVLLLAKYGMEAFMHRHLRTSGMLVEFSLTSSLR
jgi:hypothetical protein